MDWTRQDNSYFCVDTDGTHISVSMIFPSDSTPLWAMAWTSYDGKPNIGSHVFKTADEAKRHAESTVIVGYPVNGE